VKLKISLKSNTVVENTCQESDGLSPPRKPPTAYSLFFRSLQEQCREEQPEATFADITKTIEALWRDLPAQEKRSFASQSEKDKREYLKLMKEYKAKVAKENGAGDVKEEEEDEVFQDANEEDEDLVWEDEEMEVDQTDSVRAAENVESNGTSEHTAQPGMLCSRFGCTNVARVSPEWDNEFCSADCVIKHCKFVFENFFSARKSS
jgi:hypothetical protein